MNAEQQTIAIAKSCPSVIRNNKGRWQYNDGDNWYDCKDNSILKDRNAIHAIEMSLWDLPHPISTSENFIENLRRICKKSSTYPEVATLEQRIRAFITTVIFNIIVN